MSLCATHRLSPLPPLQPALESYRQQAEAVHRGATMSTEDRVLSPKKAFKFNAFRFKSLDLEAFLEEENTFRMTKEDEGNYLDELVAVDDGDLEIEEVCDEETLSQLEEGYNALRQEQNLEERIDTLQSPTPMKTHDNEPIIPLQTRSQRRNAARTARKREIRHQESTNRNVQGNITKNAAHKASQARHLVVNFDIGSLPISNPSWTGLKELPRAQLPKPSELKKLNWDGKTTTLLVDRRDRIWVVLGAGINDRSWNGVVDGATKAIAKFHQNAGLSPKDFCNRRSGNRYSTIHKGPSFGGGQKRPANMSIKKKKTKVAMKELQENQCIQRILGHTGTLYKTFGYKLAMESRDCLRTLTKQFPDIEPPKYPSPDGPYWAAFTVNSANQGPSEPQVVTKIHTDFGNYARSWCAVTAFGNFNADLGGHLVLWNVGLAIRFPAGCTILFPSALITHSNLPVQPGETRYSIVQYSAGGLFRWVANGGMSDKDFLSKATPGQLAKREQARKDRAKAGLRKYTRLFELEGGDYKGERLADESELSSIGESSDEEDDRPSKRVKIELIVV
ncbi:hypothetical protein VNI00_016495 [Paramarasmius palmivorus]|uniref:Uncharacterized protein n=1 Tax=Paramarasmius palmivorus TaxID=297713 RepID=A0AAW0BEC6_9AGAR